MREESFLKTPKVDQRAFLKEKGRTKKRKGRPLPAFEDEFEYGEQDQLIQKEPVVEDELKRDEEAGFELPEVKFERERDGVDKLTPDDARIIGDVEAEVYKDNDELINGAEDFWEDLDEAETENGNFSHGVFLDGKLVAYIVGYKDESE